MKIEIRPHAYHSETHVVAIVESRGHVYACVYAETETGFPSIEQVAQDWKTDRKAFAPFHYNF